MKKIIILSDTGKPRYGLVSHLKRLFPECEIQILSRNAEVVEEEMRAAGINTVVTNFRGLPDGVRIPSLSPRLLGS